MQTRAHRQTSVVVYVSPGDTLSATNEAGTVELLVKDGLEEWLLVFQDLFFWHIFHRNSTQASIWPITTPLSRLLLLGFCGST